MELEASGLQIGYGEHVIVNQMDVSIARDKITTIIGPNGSGKSTLLKALTRLIRYQKGNVLLDGCDIQTMKPKALAKKARSVAADSYGTVRFSCKGACRLWPYATPKVNDRKE